MTVTTTPALKIAAKKQATMKKAGVVRAPKKSPIQKIIKEEPDSRRNFDSSSPSSDANFMINLSPALRRAQTAFVNFDQQANSNKNSAVSRY